MAPGAIAELRPCGWKTPSRPAGYYRGTSSSEQEGGRVACEGLRMREQAPGLWTRRWSQK